MFVLIVLGEVLALALILVPVPEELRGFMRNIVFLPIGALLGGVIFRAFGLIDQDAARSEPEPQAPSTNQRTARPPRAAWLFVLWLLVRRRR
jgi:uncharacterized membrane protein YeaQ/YmgE (transglycosylase-associated protein family)